MKTPEFLLRFPAPFIILALIGCTGGSAGKSEHDGHGKEDDHEGKAAAHGDEARLSAEAVKGSGIRIEAVARHVLVPWLTAPARVAFDMEHLAHVGSQLKGRVVELKVKLGDQVAKGDALLVIDSPELGEAQSEYIVKQQLVAAAMPAVEFSHGSYERARKLFAENQGIAFAEVQKREGEWKIALGQLASTKAALLAAENRLHLMGLDHAACKALLASGDLMPRQVIRAPIEGRIIEREVTLGELVSPDRSSLMVIADLRTLWILADVPEARLGDVRLGAQAEISVAALGTLTITGTVSYLAPQMDQRTRTAPARIEIRNVESGLRPGMFVQARISAGDPAKTEPVLAIPESAVQTVAGESVVFVTVAGEENTFAKRAIKVGARVGRMVPVLAGLKEGEPIVVGGGFILKAELGKSGAAHEH